MKIIVDTCVWTHFLRRGGPANNVVSAELRRLIKDDAIQILGSIRQELLSGAQPEDRFNQLKEYLRFYPNLPLDEEDDETAAAYYNLCRAKGIQATSTDLLICAVAVRHRMRIFTTDGDFEAFAKHIPINLHTARGRK